MKFITQKRYVYKYKYACHSREILVKIRPLLFSVLYFIYSLLEQRSDNANVTSSLIIRLSNEEYRVAEERSYVINTLLTACER